mmetsp:Transcript_5901/g.18804  ORF Transcript_5901/g.18804 Transcript_5901/m.18804 type:complete len:284 (+) Transcript_5901:1232-2083(+)
MLPLRRSNAKARPLPQLLVATSTLWCCPASSLLLFTVCFHPDPFIPWHSMAWSHPISLHLPPTRAYWCSTRGMERGRGVLHVESHSGSAPPLLPLESLRRFRATQGSRTASHLLPCWPLCVAICSSLPPLWRGRKRCWCSTRLPDLVSATTQPRDRSCCSRARCRRHSCRIRRCTPVPHCRSRPWASVQVPRRWCCLDLEVARAAVSGKLQGSSSLSRCCRTRPRRSWTSHGSGFQSSRSVAFLQLSGTRALVPRSAVRQTQHGTWTTNCPIWTGPSGTSCEG